MEFPKETREHSRSIRWDEIAADVGEAWEPYRTYMHARNNVIEYNEVHDCLKTLHDGNGIYLSGSGGDNNVRYNAVYNVKGGAGAIRTDDDSHYNTISHNSYYLAPRAACG